MAASEWHVDTKPIADVLSARIQRGGNDCQVVELQRTVPFIRLSSVGGMRSSSLSM
jgi:hypothetical protein